ncbi:sensor histidine kinase [Planosporangium mesophilum]|nr:ATP-binding protein [Planosporangium mesophilum]
MRQQLTWRQRMARRLDPALAEPAAPAVKAPGVKTPAVNQAVPPPREHVDHISSQWAAICEQFALRILGTSYQMGNHVEAAEADEQDADRLEKLYRIDHANTRIRRQAENLQVLLGRKIEDAGRQVTPLLDVVRAATSAIEHFPRVQIGRMVDLAVVEFAADDVIRVLTELLDNATRFSPPTSSVIVSAYLTEQGSVLLRVEDGGVGVKPDQLPALNAMLAGTALPIPNGKPATHLGLVVVARLAHAQQLRVHLVNRHSGGTTATVLIPEQLLCELPVPVRAQTNGGSQRRQSAPPAVHRPSAFSYQSGAQENSARLALVNPTPALGRGDSGGRAAYGDSGGRAAYGDSGGHAAADDARRLPRRTPESLRRDHSRPSPAPAVTAVDDTTRQAWADDAADFAAGIDDAQQRARPRSEGSPE